MTARYSAFFLSFVFVSTLLTACTGDARSHTDIPRANEQVEGGNQTFAYGYLHTNENRGSILCHKGLTGISCLKKLPGFLSPAIRSEVSLSESAKNLPVGNFKILPSLNGLCGLRDGDLLCKLFEFNFASDIFYSHYQHNKVNSFTAYFNGKLLNYEVQWKDEIAYVESTAPLLKSLGLNWKAQDFKIQTISTTFRGTMDGVWDILWVQTDQGLKIIAISTPIDDWYQPKDRKSFEISLLEPVLKGTNDNDQEKSAWLTNLKNIKDVSPPCFTTTTLETFCTEYDSSSRAEFKKVDIPKTSEGKFHSPFGLIIADNHTTLPSRIAMTTQKGIYFNNEWIAGIPPMDQISMMERFYDGIHLVEGHILCEKDGWKTRCFQLPTKNLPLIELRVPGEFLKVPNLQTLPLGFGFTTATFGASNVYSVCSPTLDTFKCLKYAVGDFRNSYLAYCHDWPAKVQLDIQPRAFITDVLRDEMSEAPCASSINVESENSIYYFQRDKKGLSINKCSKDGVLDKTFGQNGAKTIHEFSGTPNFVKKIDNDYILGAEIGITGTGESGVQFYRLTAKFDQDTTFRPVIQYFHMGTAHGAYSSAAVDAKRLPNGDYELFARTTFRSAQDNFIPVKFTFSAEKESILEERYPEELCD
jgi:hypothetical protein